MKTEKVPEQIPTRMSDTTKTDSIAEALASSICSVIAKEPRNLASHGRALQDLKLAIVKDAFDRTAGTDENFERSDLIWEIAGRLPDFDTSALYQTRFSLVSLAASVLVGWLLGGLLSGILNMFGLGGDNLRAVAIFGAVWAAEYMAANPRARRLTLTVLGLGGLARFGSMLASGMLRLTSFSALKNAIFGSAIRPNIFKSVWLIMGALFLTVFLSKKIGALDIPAFKSSLTSQVEQDIKLVNFILQEIGRREEALAECEQKLSSEEVLANAKRGKELAQAVSSLLDSMDIDKRRYIAEKLANAGFEIQSPEEDYLTWNTEKYSPLYDTIGLVTDGDRCRILKRASSIDGKIIKGHVQRVLQNKDKGEGLS